jgi:hypothetical protein
VATVPSIRVDKSFQFKGGARIWSNRYHFTGGTPADSAHWTTLSDAIVTAEKAVFNAGTTIVGTEGYAAGSDVPVFQKVYSTTGTYTPAAPATAASGETVALVRYSTAARSTKNHPIYLFNYYHHVYYDNTFTSSDKLTPAQKTLFQTYAGLWVAGFSDGAITAKRASPSGHASTGSIVEEYLTHRDFPYTTSV